MTQDEFWHDQAVMARLMADGEHKRKMAVLVQTEEINMFAILRPELKQDGDQWCCLYETAEADIVGFGATPYAAILAWNKDWNKEWHKIATECLTNKTTENVPEPTPLEKIRHYTPSDAMGVRIFNMRAAQNDLLKAALYLNEGWQPDWEASDQLKWFLCWNRKSEVGGAIAIETTRLDNDGCVYFATQELANQACFYLGEETVKTALGVYLYDSI